jgi:hypothetical protein
MATIPVTSVEVFEKTYRASFLQYKLSSQMTPGSSTFSFSMLYPWGTRWVPLECFCVCDIGVDSHTLPKREIWVGVCSDYWLASAGKDKCRDIRMSLGHRECADDRRWVVSGGETIPVLASRLAIGLVVGVLLFKKPPLRVAARLRPLGGYQWGGLSMSLGECRSKGDHKAITHYCYWLPSS